ncbi:MAG: RES family NAD+ phosphorylase, partial [Chromatiales bacterium]|nr:RES family NAD+ phosphorylase [Chromatiales bacterium]
MDEGPRLDAERLGEDDASPCPRCEANDGRKLGPGRLAMLTQDYFVWGSVQRFDYGAAPMIRFNDRHKTDMDMPDALRSDAAVFEDALGIGFFLHGPRVWLLGEVEPLKALQCDETRSAVIDRILGEYGSRTLSVRDKFYRIRKNPDEPSQGEQYDSPPCGRSNGRLDTADWPVLYASPDLQICLHECRVTAEDDLFVATLRPARDLVLLDVATLLDEPREVDEFESLDLAEKMSMALEHLASSASSTPRRGRSGPPVPRTPSAPPATRRTRRPAPRSWARPCPCGT